MKVSELAGALDSLSTTVEKIAAEITALKDSLGNVDLPPEAQASLDRLGALVKAADDLNPDNPAPPA